MARTGTFDVARKVLALLLLLVALTASAVAAQERPDKVGIFDLKALRAIPLNAEVLGKTKKDGLIYEEVRFTSVPGVRIYMILSYKEGANRLPGIMVVDRFVAKTKETEAKNGYFTISVAPPSGNFDPKKKASVGGPKMDPATFSMDDHYTDDPKDSYIYHHTVALLRALDYLESRPEVDLSKTIVSGYSWPGLMVALLHALDDRPAGYVLFHGLGYYSDLDGMSGGRRAPIGRKQYEMYGAANYAKYGSKPIWMGVAMDDYFARLDSIQEFYTNLQCEKKIVYAPNRHHHGTQRGEFDYPGQYPWQTHWQMGTARPSEIAEGALKAENGKLLYTATVDERDTIKGAEVLISYGKPGNWMGRTWHSIPLKKSGDAYQAEIPVYDPKVPFYVAAQINSTNATFPTGWYTGNGLQFIEPEKLGVTAANATYPNVLFDPAKKSDLYLRTGRSKWMPADASGKSSVVLTPDEPNNDHGMIQFQNIEPQFWKGAKEISIFLKGDGKPGPVTAFLAFDPHYYLDKSVPNYTQFQLVPTGQVFANGWKEYVIPVSKISNLARVSTLFIEVAGQRPLQLGGVSWR
jgi:hypothetical protein